MNRTHKAGFIALGAYACYGGQSLPDNGRFIPADRYDWWLLIGWSVFGGLVGAAFFYAFFRFYFWKQFKSRADDYFPLFKSFARFAFEAVFVWIQFGGAAGAVIFAFTHHAYEALFLPGLPTAMMAFAALKAKRDVEGMPASVPV